MRPLKVQAPKFVNPPLLPSKNSKTIESKNINFKKLPCLKQFFSFLFVFFCFFIVWLWLRYSTQCAMKKKIKKWLLRNLCYRIFFFPPGWIANIKGNAIWRRLVFIYLTARNKGALIVEINKGSARHANISHTTGTSHFFFVIAATCNGYRHYTRSSLL